MKLEVLFVSSWQPPELIFVQSDPSLDLFVSCNNSNTQRDRLSTLTKDPSWYEVYSPQSLSKDPCTSIDIIVGGSGGMYYWSFFA